jgi:uncharacterized protein (DUF1499 family)
MSRLLHIVLALAMFGPASALPASSAERLPACPASPNCVSSDADGERHGIAAFALVSPPEEAWRAARRAVAALPRTRIVAESDTVLRAECSSAMFAFVDDLELQLRPAQGIIAVRSASRIGWSDLGVNRHRVEAIRAALIQAGALR